MAASNAKSRKTAKAPKKNDLPKKIDLPDGVKASGSGGDRTYTTEIAGQPIKLKTDSLVGQLLGGDAEVSFSVGGTFDKAGQLQGADAARAAVRVLKIMQYDAARRPDGFIYTTHAHRGDGFGKDRQRIYEKVGFSSPKENALGARQYAIVKNGKLEPYTP